MMEFNRFQWLKILAIAGFGAWLGCSSQSSSPVNKDTGILEDAGGEQEDVTTEDLSTLDGEVSLPVDPTASESTRLFQFETNPDETSQHLTEAYQTFTTAPKNEAEFLALFESRKKTLEYLKTHAEEAVQILLNELAERDPQEERAYRIVLHFLGDLESGNGLQFLYDTAVADLPNNLDPIDSDIDKNAVRGRLRYLAVTSLGRLALTGSESAKGKLLDLLEQSNDTGIKTATILAYYSAHASRSAAQQTMKSRLKPEERYLLHAVY